MKAEQHVTSPDGTRIAFDRIGSGPPIILVDAAAGFRGFGPMPALAAELAGAFTAITYDRRGRGASTDTPPYAVEREVEDLAALIEAAGGEAFVHGFSSGAALALHAAAAGVPIRRLSLLEPAIDLDPPAADEPDLGNEIEQRVAQGRRADAVEHFNRSIGVPDEYLVGMREAPFWPALEALAHTLAYDTRITAAMTPEVVASVDTPALVVNSEASDPRLVGWGREVAARLPNGTHLMLPGKWHGVAPEVLAPALGQFLHG
ncbi:MAG TPA: alpha/beta fold hydrolase [candidate division Zixibacteria bacterium]|nr:alpha/beta fold hydrolase [candidate division Zixibacteria bacterium]